MEIVVGAVSEMEDRENFITVTEHTVSITDSGGGEKMAKKKVKEKKPAFAEETMGEAPVETVPETPVEPTKKVRKPSVLGSRGGGMYAKLTTYLQGLCDCAEVTKKDIETELGAHSGYVQMCIAKAVADGFIVKDGKAKFKVVKGTAS
jgi:hypothetical protein